MKPSLQRLTTASATAAAASGAGAQEKGQHTFLSYYQATGITYIQLLVIAVFKVYPFHMYTCT